MKGVVHFFFNKKCMKGVSCQSGIQKGKALNLEVETSHGNFVEKPRISWSAYLVLSTDYTILHLSAK